MARAYLKGLPQLKAKLERLRRETMPAVRPAMEQAATVIVEMMKRLVPVEDGDLRNSIGWTWGEAPKGSIQISHTIKGNTITIFAGDDKAYYARWVEFGTAPHNVAKFGGTKTLSRQTKAHPGARAHPFFFPAYRALRKKTKLAFRKAIDNAVKKAIK